MPTWSDLMARIRPHVLRVPVQNEPETSFRGYQLVMSEIGGPLNGNLYMAQVDKPSDVEQLKPVPEVSFIVFCERDEDDDSYVPPCSNFAIILKDQMAAALEHINDLFAICFHVSVALEKMQLAVRYNYGFQYMADMISEVLGAPVDIIDGSFRFIASSDDKGIDVPLRKENVKPGSYVPMDYLEQLKSSGKLKQMLDAEDLVKLEGEPILNNMCYSMPLIINHTTVGYLSIFDASDPEKRHLRKEYISYLPIFADTVL